MESPAKTFRSLIRWVDEGRDVFQSDFLGRLPFLNSKVLDVDMSGPICGLLCVDHSDSRHVIFIDRAWTVDHVSELFQDRAQV